MRRAQILATTPSPSPQKINLTFKLTKMINIFYILFQLMFILNKKVLWFLP